MPLRRSALSMQSLPLGLGRNRHQATGFIARQSARPSGLVGRVIAGIMAHETADLNERAIRLPQPAHADWVLEVGLGHGTPFIDQDDNRRMMPETLRGPGLVRCIVFPGEPSMAACIKAR